MSQIKKRQRNIDLSSNVIYKNKKLKNCIENLSNEIFYEIFDYLDGRDIYRSFSNLNIRIENLLTNPLLLLKIKFLSKSKSEVEYHYKQFIYPNKHQIISLHFYNELVLNKFFTLCTLDSLFTRLESVVFDGISTFKLLVLLFYLKSLPRLFSLTVFIDHCHDDVGDICRIVFQLPLLKYFQLVIADYQVSSFSLPMATKEQHSSIEYLSIYHDLTVNNLAHLLSYTPRLTHLYCFGIFKSNILYQSEILIPSKNLIHLTISIQQLTFDEFEELIVKISSQLKSLRVKFQWTDKSYFDANRWERLIVQHIPYLTKFNFTFFENIDKEFKLTPSHALSNYFVSPFWSNRQWTFQTLIEGDSLVHSIRPYIHV